MAIAANKPIEHGTKQAYDYRKCRCDECRAAAAAYQRDHPSAHIPKGLTKAEAVVLLDMVDESLDSIAATFNVKREEILALIRSRAQLGKSFKRSPTPLVERLFIVEDQFEFPDDESSVVGVGKKTVDIRPAEPLTIIRSNHVGYVAPADSPLMTRVIALRSFVSDEPIACHGCGKECSGGISRELDNGPGEPHTFRVHCAECDPGPLAEHPNGPLRMSSVNYDETGYLTQVTADEYGWSKRGKGFVRKGDPSSRSIQPLEPQKFASRMIGKPRRFSCEDKLSCRDCGVSCSSGWAREMSNGRESPRTFIVYCPACSTGWQQDLGTSPSLTLRNTGSRLKGYVISSV